MLQYHCAQGGISPKRGTVAGEEVCPNLLQFSSQQHSSWLSFQLTYNKILELLACGYTWIRVRAEISEVVMPQNDNIALLWDIWVMFILFKINDVSQNINI